MAISAACVWEIRQNATAANVNGGGFVTGATGVDYSQQATAQYNLTGIASAGAGNVVLSAAAAADMVGNIAHVISGTNYTTGWFEITSVSVGVSITFGTNVAGASISTGVGASGVINIGGALSLANTDDATALKQAQPGNKIYWKSGTYALGQAISGLTSTTLGSSPIKVIGYNSARDDKPTVTNMPAITASSNTTTQWPNGWEFSYLNFSGSDTAGFNFYPGQHCKVSSCKIVNTTTTASQPAINLDSANILLVGCELISYRGPAVNTTTVGSHIINNYIHSSDMGITSAATSGVVTIMGNLIENCTTNAIRFSATHTGGSLVMGNTLVGTPAKRGTGINIAVSTGIGQIRTLNNIITGFATGIAHASSSIVAFERNNDYFNNTADVTNWSKGPDAIALDPGFSSVAEITGTNGTTAAGILTSSGANFATVTNNQDFLYVASGTGVTAGMYLITSHTGTTITTSPALANDATADKVFSIITGHNYAPGVNVKATAYAALPPQLTTSYVDTGAVQRVEPGTSTDPGVANVRSGTGYSINGASLTGTLTSPGGGGGASLGGGSGIR